MAEKTIQKMTFEIDEDQMKKLKKWQDAIKLIYGEYGNFEYRFSSGGGIGLVVKVYSELAEAEIDLTDVSKW
jgi:hypothetical protein